MYMSKHTESFWMVTHYLAVTYLYSFLLQFPIQAKRDKIKVRLLELQILSIINIVFGEFRDHPLTWRFTIRTHKTQHIVVFMANTYYSNVVWTYSLIDQCMSLVHENFYVQLNILEERDVHQNKCSLITELSLESVCPIMDIFAKLLASW